MRNKDDDDFVLRPKRARSVRRDRPPKLKVFFRRGTAATRTFAVRAIGKITYSNFDSTKAGSATAHVRYLLREAAQSHSLGVETRIGTCPPESFLHPLPGEKRVYKVVLSPEEFFTLDPTLFTHTFVNELQSRAGPMASGKVADWCAVVHTNTENPHIHVLIHGVTKNGKEDFYLHPEVIKDGSGLATRIQSRMVDQFPISEGLRLERRRTRSYQPMPPFEGKSLDSVILGNSGKLDWKELLERVPFYRRRGLHQRMVFLENHDLLFQAPTGKVVVRPDMPVRLQDLERMKGLISSLAKPVYLSSAGLEWANARTPTCFGLVTSTVVAGRHRYAIVETTKDTVLSVRVPDGQDEIFATLIRERSLVRLKAGKVARFRGDPTRLIRVALHSKGPVAQAILTRQQPGLLAEQPNLEALKPQTKPKDFGY